MVSLPRGMWRVCHWMRMTQLSVEKLSHQGCHQRAMQPQEEATKPPVVGRDVILYAVLRSDIPVAKATIVSTKPSTLVGDEPLGVQFYEVVVNVVLKRDALLPRPYDDCIT
uniref:Transposase Tnp1/En/Spm-like domain-containing protein n=1 Tax=Oryza punctata TaxID=4537 RepID=A0A0E0MIJ8_ORYPU